MLARVAKVAIFQTLSFSGCRNCRISDFIIFRTSRLRGLERLQNFRLDHFQDIKVARIGKFAKFQTLSFPKYQGFEGCKGCKISDSIILRIPRLRGLHRLQNFRLYRFQEIKVAKVVKFQTLSFSGYQGFKGFKGCKISDSIILSISMLRGLHRLQNFRLYRFQDIKVARVGKVAEFQSLSFSGYQCCEV